MVICTSRNQDEPQLSLLRIPVEIPVDILYHNIFKYLCSLNFFRKRRVAAIQFADQSTVIAFKIYRDHVYRKTNCILILLYAA